MVQDVMLSDFGILQLIYSYFRFLTSSFPSGFVLFMVSHGVLILVEVGSVGLGSHNRAFC